MSAIVQAVASEQQQSKRGLDQTVELIAKSAAAGAIAVYALGFIVTSLHHSRFGFTVTSPLRPRIVSAGIWLLVFAGAPLMVAKKFPAKNTENLRWPRLPRLALLLMYTSLTMTQLFSLPFETSQTQLPRSFWVIVISLFTLAVAASIIALRCDVEKRPHLAGVAATVGVLAFLALFVNDWLISREVKFGAVALWLFASIVVSLIELRTTFNWQSTTFAILGAVLLFSTVYYPHILSSWGGGSPVPVVIYFSKDSPILANQQFQARLVDEADAGYYVVPNGEKKAIFIPRNSVSLLYFSEKESDSELLSQPRKP